MRVENVICALDKEWASGWDQKIGLLRTKMNDYLRSGDLLFFFFY